MNLINLLFSKNRKLNQILFNQNIIINLLNKIQMTEKEAADALNALTEKVKGIEAKIQVLIDSAKAAGNVSADVQTAIDNLAAEIGNADTEAGV